MYPLTIKESASTAAHAANIANLIGCCYLPIEKLTALIYELSDHAAYQVDMVM